MAEKIKRFFECYIPVTVCNLKCEYCYVPQNHWKMGQMPTFKYTPEQIARGFSKERLGGECYFSLCGGGETLFPKEVPDIAAALLQGGHYVNITTNGTFSQGFDKLLAKIPSEMIGRFHIAFSFHYLELKRLHLLEVFVSNVLRMRKAGCSIVVQLNLYDGYLPVLDEIKGFSLKHFGAMPQVAATRKEGVPISLLSHLSRDEYKKIGDQFCSPLFDFTMRNFMIPRKEFCYAGDWTFVADLGAGWIMPCYCSSGRVDIFANPDRPIKFEAIGHGCRGQYCQNSSHFMSLGCIPQLFPEVTYASLRNRPEACWYSEEMSYVLNRKLSEANEEYSLVKRCWVDIKRKGLPFVERCINYGSRRILGRNLIDRGGGFVR